MENYLSEKSLIADIVKEFKATGNFDKLRKEFHSEIASQVKTSTYLSRRENFRQFI
jgi:hypothetical protein